MSERIGWDKYETALLIDACEKVLSGDLAKPAVVSELSSKLRQRAVSRGMQIDDIFRNENGIALQMTKMDYLLTEGEKGLPGASRFYGEMISLKKTNPLAYADILREAKRQIGVEGSENKTVSNTKDLFVDWLNKQTKLKFTPNAIISVLEESFDYATKHGITKKLLWDITDPTEVVRIFRKLSENRLFRITKRKTASILDKVYVYYRDYLVEQSDGVPQPVTVVDSTINDTPVVANEPSNTVAKATAKKDVPVQPEKVKEALCRLYAETSRSVSVLRIYDEGVGGTLPEIKAVLEQADWAVANGNCYIYKESQEVATVVEAAPSSCPASYLVDFAKTDGYAYTTPIKLRYFTEEYSDLRSWTNLYVTLVGLLYRDHCEVFTEGMRFSVRGSGRLETALDEQKDLLVSPKQIPGSPLYIETNISASNIVTKIKFILDLCKVGCENVAIYYDKDDRHAVVESNASTTTNEPTNSSGSIEDGFVEWMQRKGMADATVRGYASSVRSAQQYAKRNGIEGVNLISNDTAEILRSIDTLLANKAFFKYNQEQHNRFSAAFRKLRDYIAELNRKIEQKSNDVALEMLYPELYQKLFSVSKIYDDPQGITVDHIESIVGIKGESWLRNNIIEILDGVSWATKISEGVYSFSKKAVVQAPVVEQPKLEPVVPTDFDKDAFIRVLMMRYQSGMQFDSIDFENFRDAYDDLFDEKLTFTDEELEVRLRLCGIYYSDRLFPAEGIIDSATSVRLFSYIENKFAAGNKVLYYKAIFSDLADAFAYCFSLTDEKMLKAYIEFMTEEGKYYFHSDYMSTEKNVKIDHSAEIIDFMLSAGKPLSYDEIYTGLSHISTDIIYREIRWNPVFIMNEKEHYFHIDIFEFSGEDANKISEILNKEIEENGYVIWSRTFDTIQDMMPVFLENNLYLSSLGIRNALSVKMNDRFGFDGDVICAYGEHLGMADVYRLYATHHAHFTDIDVYNFSKELGSPIYFWALAEGSVRVSKQLFVAKDQVAFDVDAVDKALETYLSSGYILVKDVDSFLVFPNVGYEWNEFLLESFLLHYSKKFCLVNNGSSLNNVAGAVAKKDGAYTEFVDVCAQALADSGIELKKTVALNYLADINLITRRSYKDLDVAMTKARQIRNRKG